MISSSIRRVTTSGSATCRHVEGERIADREIGDRDQHRDEDGDPERMEMGRVPVAGVARRAEEEIAVVLERIDVFRAAALDGGSLGWNGIVDHVELREHDQEQRPEADGDQQEESRPARRCAGRTRARRWRPSRRRSARAASAKNEARRSGPSEDQRRSVNGLVMAHAPRAAGWRRRARSRRRCWRRSPARARRRRGQASSSRLRRRTRAARHG